MKKPRHHERVEKTVNMLYILPMLLVFAVFILYPMTSVMKLSLFDKKINGDMLFVGCRILKTFSQILTRREFCSTPQYGYLLASF